MHSNPANGRATGSKQKSRFISANRAKEKAMQTKLHFLKTNIWFGMAHGVEEENIMNIPGLWGLLYTWIPFPVVFPLLYWHCKMSVRGAANVFQKFNLCYLLWAGWWHKLHIIHPGLCRKTKIFLYPFYIFSKCFPISLFLFLLTAMKPKGFYKINICQNYLMIPLLISREYEFLPHNFSSSE